MTDSRPAIPEAIKRAVRQRCRFGCVICGVPLFHYDHIKPYADAKDHAVDNITLLCPNHHQMKTSGRISESTVAECDREPFNLKADFVSPFSPGYYRHSGDQLALLIGGNGFSMDARLPGLYPVVSINKRLVIGLERTDVNEILLHLYLFDAAGRALVIVHANELTFAISETWDYTFVGQALIIKSSPNQIMLAMRFGGAMISLDQCDLYAPPPYLAPLPDRSLGMVALQKQLVCTPNGIIMS